MSGLLDGYDGVLLDLDGTVVRGAHAVGEAPKVVNELRQAGLVVHFITNNAFGGSDMKTLYVTAGKTLYRIRMDIPGLPR